MMGLRRAGAPLRLPPGFPERCRAAGGNWGGVAVLIIVQSLPCRSILWSLLVGLLIGSALTLGLLGTGRTLSQEHPRSAIDALTASLGPRRLTEGRLSRQPGYARYPTPNGSPVR